MYNNCFFSRGFVKKPAVSIGILTWGMVLFIYVSSVAIRFLALCCDSLARSRRKVLKKSIALIVLLIIISLIVLTLYSAWVTKDKVSFHTVILLLLFFYRIEQVVDELWFVLSFG